MSNIRLAQAGAIAFGLWGLLHVVGGIAIFVTGFAAYGDTGENYPALALAILNFLAFALTLTGLAVVLVAAKLNWRNSPLGLAINTALAGAADLGLILFLVLPGHVSWLEAAPGLVLLAIGLAVSTAACRSQHAGQAAS